MTKQPLYDTFQDACRENGLRLTHQRFEIYRALVSQTEHVSAEQVFKRARRTLRTISLDTVYRTLDTFARVGIVRKFVSSQGLFRFDPVPDQHHHIICQVCGRIQDFDWPAFERLRLPSSVSGFGKVQARRVEIDVVCDSCAKSKMQSQ